jgi:hypothetical protein
VAPNHDHAMTGLLDLPQCQVLDVDVDDEVNAVETDVLVLAAQSPCCAPTKTQLPAAVRKVKMSQGEI